MTEIETYREEILQQALSKMGTPGRPKLDERDVRELLAAITDEQLEEGMPFNTPEEVADLLFEV
ncbi:MAG: hypothetical protein PUH24_06630 [Prevotellaceae bacterium]|nr:hypothetical protein [Prevotella sp.]MDD7257925.1 hypothetical protein [Prevotellaceae bacterium]MDY6129686.1 hypothetical protein [Prevotella sp.]